VLTLWIPHKNFAAFRAIIPEILRYHVYMPAFSLFHDTPPFPHAGNLASSAGSLSNVPQSLRRAPGA